MSSPDDQKKSIQLVPEDSEENSQQLQVPVDSGAYLLGENVEFKAQNCFANCTIYNAISENRRDDESSQCPRKRTTVEASKLLVEAISEDDSETIKSVIKDMGNNEIIEALLCELQADFKSNPIRYACAQLNFSTVQILLSKLSFSDQKHVIGNKGHDGLSAFHVAVEQGNRDLVLKLLDLQLAHPKDSIPVSTQRNVKQDTRTKPGDNALDIAALTGDTQLLEELQNYILENDQIAIEDQDPEMEYLVLEEQQADCQVVQYAQQQIHPVAEEMISNFSNAISRLQTHISQTPYSNLLSSACEVLDLIFDD